MHGFQAPNAGGGLQSNYTTTLPGARLNKTQKTRGAPQLGVSSQQKQKSCCAPLQKGVKD